MAFQIGKYRRHINESVELGCLACSQLILKPIFMSSRPMPSKVSSWKLNKLKINQSCKMWYKLHKLAFQPHTQLLPFPQIFEPLSVAVLLKLLLSPPGVSHNHHLSWWSQIYSSSPSAAGTYPGDPSLIPAGHVSHFLFWVFSASFYCFRYCVLIYLAPCLYLPIHVPTG